MSVRRSEHTLTNQSQSQLSAASHSGKGWRIEINESSEQDAVSFVNKETGERIFEVPLELDTWDKLAHLTELNLSHNKLEYLVTVCSSLLCLPL